MYPILLDKRENGWNISWIHKCVFQGGKCWDIFEEREQENFFISVQTGKYVGGGPTGGDMGGKGRVWLRGIKNYKKKTN